LRAQVTDVTLKIDENTEGKAVTSRASRDRFNQTLFSPRTLASAVLVAIAALSTPADAAGLGRLTVQSALGQPLVAEVEVTSIGPGEAQSLSARLATPDAFRQAGLEYNPALSSLRFAIENRASRTFVRITSAQPINEPFVDLLVELNWTAGKFVREYTFLLDPPELRATRPAAEPGATAAVPASAFAARTAGAGIPAAPAAPAPRAAASAAVATRAEGASSGGVRPDAIEVRRGDTLGRIAADVRPEGVSLDQAMVAIFRANPRAFANNVNLVREGARLTIPTAEAMAAVDTAEAGRLVRLHSADFAAYRQRLASAPRTVDTPRSGATAAGTVGGQVEDRSTTTEGDQLRLSRPAAGAAAGSAALGAQASRGSAVEQGVARDAALREANSRVADLERNVSDLQKLLELRNRSLADIEKQLADARAAARTVTGQVGAPVSSVAASASGAAPASVEAAPKGEAPASSVTSTGDAPQAESPKADAPGAAASAPQAATSLTPLAPLTPAEPKAPAPAVQTSLLDDVLENPYLLPAIGGIALLGAGYGWYALRRRRKVESFEDSLIAADAFTANSLFGATGGQSVDTRNSVFAPVTASSAADVHSTEVDPIAEADVYIAYGREGQAEEILKEALRRQPERQAIRAKLAEIYSGRKDVRAFEGVARELHQMTGGQSEEWPKVAAMGLALDPGNALYGGVEPARSGPSSAAAAVGAGAVAAGVAAQASDSLDFPELRVDDLDTPDRIEPELSRTAQALDDIPNLDFDLNLDTRPAAGGADRDDGLGDALADAGAAVESPADRAAALDSRFELPTLDLSSSLEAETQSLERLDLDLPALDGLTEISREASAAGLDLSPLSLDLEPAVMEVADASAGGAGRWQEMATKLDLASAYEEIGDKEGARELLQEVIKGGDNGQQQKARAMLSKIG